jgi:hypothetical protein
MLDDGSIWSAIDARSALVAVVPTDCRGERSRV